MRKRSSALHNNLQNENYILVKRIIRKVKLSHKVPNFRSTLRYFVRKCHYEFRTKKKEEDNNNNNTGILGRKEFDAKNSAYRH